MAKGPRVGDVAPDFELEGTEGRFHLAEHRGERIVLLFYPGDETPVCTKQFCSYRDDGDRIEGLGVPMLGISPQSVDSHERFVDKHGLNVPLASDPERRVARRYGVVGPGGFIRRSVFLLDSELIITYQHIALFGLRYQDVGDLEREVAKLQ